MPFVKLDTGMLNSTLWVERECRELFITALLMAEPKEVIEDMPQIEVRSLELTGWNVPAGWYGFVAAAGVGIIRRAVMDHDVGLIALEKLGAPDHESRSLDFGGRRLVRVDGGYIVLNYMKYRERDYTTAERSKRYREKKAASPQRDFCLTLRDVTQAEVDAEADADNVKPKAQAPFPLPDWIPVDQWNAWIESRKKQRKPPTAWAMKLAVSKLADLREQGHHPAAVLAESAFHGWAGLFPVKEAR